MKLREIVCLAVLVFSVGGAAQQDDSGNQDDLDLDSLVDRISHSKAIGFFTKLSLKGDIDGFLKNVRSYHDGNEKISLDQLHERYELMVHKLVVLLQDKDDELVKTIDDSREKLWAILADEQRFARM